MNTTTTAQDLFNEAFPIHRPERSSAYRLGVFKQLLKLVEHVDYSCSYRRGTAEYDAFWAGTAEAWNIVELSKLSNP